MADDEIMDGAARVMERLGFKVESRLSVIQHPRHANVRIVGLRVRDRAYPAATSFEHTVEVVS